MDITVKNLQSSIPIQISKIKSVAQKVGNGLKPCLPAGKAFPTDISIVFVGTQRMRTMNRKYLGHDFVTDVITFDLEGSAELMICPQVAAQNAKAHNVSLNREILLYVIHGFLHLAGFDDHSPQEIKRMRFKEQELLEKFV